MPDHEATQASTRGASSATRTDSDGAPEADMSSDLPTADRRVAVIVRTKNRPALLSRALASISAQTHDDITVVIVNDGGDVAPVDALVAGLTPEQRSRIEVVHHPSPVGRAAALNAGLAATSSPLVAVHDDDDSWHPDFLTRTVGHLLATADDMGVAVRTEVVFERVDGTEVVEERREILAADNHAVTLFDMILRDYAPPISVIYRRSVHDTTGPYDQRLPVLEDWDFMLRLVSRYRVGFIDGEPLAFWHQRPGATGDDGNSVAPESGEHQRWDTVIRDMWLRRDLAAGAGLGALMHLAEALDRDRRLAGDRAGAISAAVGSLHLNTDALTQQVAELTAEVRRQGATLDRLLEEAKHAALRDDRAASLLSRSEERLQGLTDAVSQPTPSPVHSLADQARRLLRRS